MPTLPVIVAGALVAAAVFVFLVRWRRRRAVRTGFMDMAALRQLSWEELEILIEDYFVREGFIVRERGSRAVDFVIEKAGRTWIVQCKHWRARQVAEADVRDLFGHMAARRAAGAFLLTSGRFTGKAVQFASGKRIELVDGDALIRMIEEVQQDPSEITQSRLDAMREGERTQPRRVILCPRCGRAMTRRQDRAREAAGKSREYYGCSRYPACKGRREIA